MVMQFQDYPKRIRLNQSLQKQNITELKSIELSQEDIQNKLFKQKGIIEYLIIKLKIQEQINDQERLDLELIEKDFGELFIEDLISLQTFSHMDKIQNIIQGLEANINESLKLINDQQFNYWQLKNESEKYNHLLSQLKLKDQFKNRNQGDELVIQYLKTLIEEIEKISKKFSNSLNQNMEDKQIQEILKMIINEQLGQLQIFINKCNYQEEDQIKESNQLSPKRIENQVQKYQQCLLESEIEEQLQEKQSLQENYLNKKKDKTLGINQSIVYDGKNQLRFEINEKSRINLQIIIKVIKLQQIKIKDDYKSLDQLLQEIKNFQVQLDLIQTLKKETQEKIIGQITQFFKNFIKIFEDKQLIRINLKQQLNENFSMYFNRIQTQIQYVESNINENNDLQSNFQQINASDFLFKLKDKIREQLVDKIQLQQDKEIDYQFLIQKISMIYQLDNFQQDICEESNEELNLFDTYLQNYKDFKNNHEWKIKQGLVLGINQNSSNCYTDRIISFCQKALIQLWAQEKDQRVRNLLKNQDLISLQIQILQQDWMTQHDRIACEMQQMLRKIDDLQESIVHEANLNKREQQLQELDETTQNLDEYLENISEMGQQLKLITDFVNHIRKGLIRLEGKITQMKEQLNRIGNDIKFLRGKSVKQLLEIRKWKVLKESSQKNLKSIYIPLKTQKNVQNSASNQSYLMNLEQYDDKNGEINEFLLEDKTVLLIHGIAGSGKNTTARKIEEFVWKLHDKNIKIKNQIVIPIYIYLPSLKMKKQEKLMGKMKKPYLLNSR